MSLIRWREARDLPAFPSDVLDMQREINKMFESFFRSSLPDESPLIAGGWSPATDIVEHEDNLVVNVELPGMRKEDVKITMQDNTLMIRGEKKEERESKGSSYHRVERSYGSFQRSFALPSTVKAESIEAMFKDGILSVTLPKSEEAKPKQIDVKVK